jgi:hypothetical protein
MKMKGFILTMKNNEEVIDAMIERSRKAQYLIEECTQEELDKISAAIMYYFSKEEVAREIAVFLCRRN